jgi:cyclopropane fatty-acyl-phospholipid synthase-like methyltransferase
MEFPFGFLSGWFILCSLIFWNNWTNLFILFLITPLSLVITLLLYFFIGSRLQDFETKLKSEYEGWIIINDPKLKNWEGQKISIREAYEWYFRGQIDFTRPVLEVFLHRFELFRMIMTGSHFGEVLNGVMWKGWAKHDQIGDANEVRPVYNLGNDFYYSFLSDPMFYSSGIAYDSKDTLVDAQERKCGITGEVLDLQDGDRILDFGCGWGSWLIYCARHFNVDCVGLTISQNQFDYATKRIKEEGLQNKISILLLDYRKLIVDTYGKFDKITCFEMSEHVGIRNYQLFMAQVRSLLKNDGLFYLQIAGLRRAWRFEDLLWGNFMGKYIFPGADASCPLYWDVNQCERAGFEIHQVRNNGVHYAHTIEQWYHNLVENKDEIFEKFGKFAYRRHELFLAWSTMIARQGSSTVYAILMSHNTPVDAFSVHHSSEVELNRTKKMIRRGWFTSLH